MTQDMRIPKEEQLAAVAEGLPEVYRLMERYTGRKVMSDFRKYLTITKEELTEYLRNHPALAEKQVQSSDRASKKHDVPALIAEGSKWVVCWMDHGTRTDVVTFDALPEAAASFLMAYWE